MGTNNTYIKLTGTRIRETSKAVQFQIQSLGNSTLDEPVTSWFPLSQVDKSFTDPNNLGQDEIHVAEWILRKNDTLAEYLP